MSIFEHTDYKEFIRAWVESRPKNGRGEYRRIASYLGLSSTMVSQIFRGDKHLSSEHAATLCDFLELGHKQTDYFLLLVDWQKAGTTALKQKLERRLSEMQNEALRIANRVAKDTELSEEQKAIYYSSWHFSAFRNLIATGRFPSAEALAVRLQLPLPVAEKVLDFLLETRLCVKDEKNLAVGAKKTHLPASSPLVIKHHQNWRLQGFTKMPFSPESNLFYTGPMSLSAETAAEIRRRIPAFIEEIVELVGDSPSDLVRCLNVDWFEY